MESFQEKNQITFQAMTKVSIIIPCYSVERYLNRCMDTIVNQTLKDIEIILVDDKSPDRVPEMCDEWAKKDKRIKVIHKKKNEGLGLARNTGLEIATGDYVAFVDSDDYVDTEMFSRLYEKAVETQSDIVYCGVKREITQNNFIDVRDFNEQTIFEKNEMQELSFRYVDPDTSTRLFMSVWHSIYMRTTIGSLRFYSERIVCSEDLPFQLVMILKSNRVTYIPEAMYYYCLNGCSLSNTFDFEKCFRYFTLAKIIKEYYTQEQEYHIWRFFFTFCQNFLRGLVLSDIPRKEKCKWLMQLCGNNEIVSYLKEYKYWFGKKPHSHLFAQYHYFITHGNVMLLYLTASIDQYVICDKLGLKKTANT